MFREIRAICIPRTTTNKKKKAFVSEFDFGDDGAIQMGGLKFLSWPNRPKFVVFRNEQTNLQNSAQTYFQLKIKISDFLISLAMIFFSTRLYMAEEKSLK